MDAVQLKQDQAGLQIWEGESVACWALASSGHGARGAVEGHPLPYLCCGGRALPAGAELRDHPGGKRVSHQRGTQRAAGARKKLYFYI